MGQALNDLLQRVFGNLRSSVTALVVVVAGFLSDYGITLSQVNINKAAAWALLAIVALERLLGVDPPKEEEKQ